MFRFKNNTEAFVSFAFILLRINIFIIMQYFIAIFNLSVSQIKKKKILNETNTNYVIRLKQE